MAAAVMQSYHGDASALSITRLGTTTAVSTDATVHSEKIRWRYDSSGNSGARYQVITRVAVLPNGAADVPVGSRAVHSGTNYRVESVQRSPASGSQVLTLMRQAVGEVSRPNSEWG